MGDNAGQSSQKCRPAGGNRDVRDTTATSTRYDVPVLKEVSVMMNGELSKLMADA